MLAGIGLTEVLLPVAVRPIRARWWHERPEAGEATFMGIPAGNVMRSWAPVLLAVFLWYATNGALMRAAETPDLVALSPDERGAMTWVSHNTPPDSRFLIVTAEGWPTDKTAEWFPVLAQRVSVDTVQGYEWVAGGAFATRTT